MNKDLYDENGEYIGWKQGKPYYLNHGPHKYGLIPIENNPDFIILCADCKIILSKQQISKLKSSTPWSVRIEAIITGIHGSQTIGFTEI